MNLEKYSEAIPFLEKVLIHDALPDDMRSTITYYLGKCHYGCLNFSPALRLFSEVLRVNRKNSVLLLVPKSDPKCYK